MLLNLKAMIIVLTIAISVFAIAKPICLRYIAYDDFARRRNAWIALTLAGFLSPSFWLFVGVAAPILAWAARKDTNPVAWYVFIMHVIPPPGLQIPVVGINQLFELTSYRLLSFAILIPAVWRLMRSSGKADSRAPVVMDVLLISYVVLQLVLYMPHESFTHTLRRSFLFFADILALYFVVSRTCTSRRAIVDAMCSFCLACAIFAPLALFETMRSWLLYQGIGLEWGNADPFSYLTRGGILRAEVSAGHSITLGYMMALAFGFWLCLRSRLQSAVMSNAVAVWLCIGLLAAYSRAPWVVAATIFVAYPALVPRGLPRLFKALFVGAIFAGLILVSPVGERVIDNLPFVGTVGAETVVYRELVAERSWQVIQANPFFGSPDYILQMEGLRQAQGIIDLMNSYAVVAMTCGVVGLSLFVAFFVVGMWRSYRVVRISAGSDAELAMVGASLLACMLGTLVMMATGSFGGSLAQMYWVLAGLAAGYAQLRPIKDAARVERPHEPGTQFRRTLHRG